MSRSFVAAPGQGGLDRPDVIPGRLSGRPAADSIAPALVDVAFRAPPSLRLMIVAAYRGVGELYISDGLTTAAGIAYYAIM